MTAQPRRALAAMIATAGALAAAVFLLPRFLEGRGGVDLRPACDLNRGECVVMLDAGRAVAFSIAPLPIPVLTPLRLQLATRGFAAPPSARVEFVGVGMDMGFNAVDLRRTAADRLAGDATLPVCVTGTMTWEARVSLSPADGNGLVRRIAFRFLAPLPASR